MLLLALAMRTARSGITLAGFVKSWNRNLSNTILLSMISKMPYIPSWEYSAYLITLNANDVTATSLLTAVSVESQPNA